MNLASFIRFNFAQSSSNPRWCFRHKETSPPCQNEVPQFFDSNRGRFNLFDGFIPSMSQGRQVRYKRQRLILSMFKWNYGVIWYSRQTAFYICISIYIWQQSLYSYLLAWAFRVSPPNYMLALKQISSTILLKVEYDSVIFQFLCPYWLATLEQLLF